MNISHKGLGELVTTFQTDDENIQVGDFITIEDNLAIVVTNGKMDGIAVSTSENGYVGVQIGGYAETKYSGSTPYTGTDYIEATSASSVSVSTSATTDGRLVQVIYVDTDSKRVGFIL